MSSHSAAEVAEHFAEYLKRVVDQGETLVVTKEGVPVAELRPSRGTHTIGDFVESIPHLPYVDDDDREQFARDLEAAHKEMNAVPPAIDPWES